jgi:hypothetical protein
MPERVECLQMKTGNCGGCQIPEFVEQRVRKQGEESRAQAVLEVSREWCPPGYKMLLPEFVKKSRIW